ncbi:MarR family winged helix-turn-helix transcriptional regulator [Streptomyces sp. SID13726]|uniref:MarR family winged helix-turn-helix transcriptional regulator n=1 Tax=Streptomyces sp. SID13726 TaxID=2706058 RepID=UPI0013B99C0F|nr:MarR family winged helix-turn-helix transcriptional regulator [Streptomyces sp. SID13726]NEB02740.1 winged helix-turn-helix transcriptional regulator [Streptomyces sp. SID13726]
MTTTTPLLDPRVIALAHYAGRALLERVLARHGVTFQQSVTLRLAAVAEGPVERDRVVEGVVGALKIDPAEAQGVVDELIAAGLLAPQEPSRVRITDAGRELYARTSAETAPVSARIYAGIPTEDLAVAGRVLSLITERADAELAVLGK